MKSLTDSLNYMLPQDLHFKSDNIQQILQKSPTNTANTFGNNNVNNTNKKSTIIKAMNDDGSAIRSGRRTNASIPLPYRTAYQTVGVTPVQAYRKSVGSNFLHKLGATLLNSIQLRNYQQNEQIELQDKRPAERLRATTTTSIAVSAATASSIASTTAASLLTINHIQEHQHEKLPQTLLPISSLSSLSISPSLVDMNFVNSHYQHASVDPRNYDTVNELQKQVEHDKFMNEIWIGVVLTLIFISMVFCFCSCFLYHQFILWKRNYRSTLVESQSLCDTNESSKTTTDVDDPVPSYTLVSGLPSYEAALELLRKTQQTCLSMHPTVFTVFEKLNNTIPEDADSNATRPSSNLESHNLILNNDNCNINDGTIALQNDLFHHRDDDNNPLINRSTTVTFIHEKLPLPIQQPQIQEKHFTEESKESHSLNVV